MKIEEPVSLTMLNSDDVRTQLDVVLTWKFDVIALEHVCKHQYVATDRTSAAECTAIARARPSVCFHRIFRTNSSLTLMLCLCVGHDCSSPGIVKVKVIGQGAPSLQ